MKKWLFAVAATLVAGAAVAQYAPGGQKVTVFDSLNFQVPVINQGPQNAFIPLTGGKFTCAASAATVTNTAVTAGSNIVITLKTVGGTVAQPFIATITPGTGFTVTCGGSDTSTYNFIILG